VADKPVAEVVNVDAVIDALSPSPTSSDVYEATLPFNPHAVAASAVRRAGEDGSPPDLASVLAEGGDPEGNPVTPVTGPLTIDLAGHPAIAGLLVLDHNGVPIFGVSGAGIGTPTLLGRPTLHADEHGVTISLDGLSDGLVVATRDLDVPFTVSATGSVSISPTATSPDPPLRVYDRDGLHRIVVEVDGTVYLGHAKSRISPDGVFITSVHSAPADGDINAGDCAIWFDQTDGAAKLMIKAKTADGTVASGNVPLT
jgi:hypothetical protein